MSFQRYPEYKDSGVEWLGEVPAHWEVKRLRHLVECLDGKRVPLNSAERADRPGDVPYWGANAIMGYVDQPLFDEELVLLGEDGAPFFDAFRPVAFRSIGPVWPNNHIHVLRPNQTTYTKFIVQCLNVTDYANFIDGSTRDKLTQAGMNSIPLPWPSRDEALLIASFLDRETAKIDALVAEQEKLIALLQEKRQAVISHAVTKGLDPNAPMKDSGVEWLGEVPGHWEVCALRRVIATIEQGWSPECYAREAEEQEWGVLKAGCLNGGNFRPSENKALPPELCPEEAYEVRVGDVLMSRASGSPELVGSTALVKATRERLMLSDKIFRLKLKEFVNTAFFVAALNSRPLRIQIENALSGGNGMANNLPQSSLMTFAMAVPTLAEQATITVFLEQETAKLDILMAEARTAITLLQERRTALISAAVTGQIDVRSIASREVA